MWFNETVLRGSRLVCRVHIGIKTCVRSVRRSKNRRCVEIGVECTSVAIVFSARRITHRRRSARGFPIGDHCISLVSTACARPLSRGSGLPSSSVITLRSGSGRSPGTSSVIRVKSSDSRSITTNVMCGSASRANYSLGQVNLIDEFDILQIVGEGWFGKILLTEHRSTQTEMVLKALPKAYTGISDFFREFHYGLHLSAHRNIITTYDVAFETAGFYVFSQEYAPLGERFFYDGRLHVRADFRIRRIH